MSRRSRQNVPHRPQHLEERPERAETVYAPRGRLDRIVGDISADPAPEIADALGVTVWRYDVRAGCFVARETSGGEAA